MKRFKWVFIFVLLYQNAFTQVYFKDRIKLNPNIAPFYHGIASGDALADRVIIWTRVTPDSGYTGSIPVNWKMATDLNFVDVVASGEVIADSSTDYCIKVDVTGLQPGTWYYYYFNSVGRNSVTGRTKTLPLGDIENIRVVPVSGSNYNAGFFNAYRSIGNRNDIDAVIHTGDYTYEYRNNGYGDDPNRQLEPTVETVSLNDYRLRQSHYHLDPDLQWAHQQFPWYTIWDDHEICNNSYKDGAGNHDESTEGDWHVRVNAGVKAYYEWLPIREQDTTNLLKIYRKIHYGDLADFIFLETRLLERSLQDINIDDTNKTMMGREQFSWLKLQLANPLSRWKLITQQVTMAPLEAPIYGPINKDAWDGYRWERSKLLNYVKDSINNTVVITGDIHTAWANDLPANKNNYDESSGAGSACVEFITPAVTSASFPYATYGLGPALIKLTNPWVKYVDIEKKGYCIIDITKTRTQCDFYFVNTIGSRSFTETFNDSWYVNLNERTLIHNGGPSSNMTAYPPKPSENPDHTLSLPQTLNTASFTLLGVYPNPFIDIFAIQFYIFKEIELLIIIEDINGNVVYKNEIGKKEAGLHYLTFSGSSYPSGTYLLTLKSSTGNSRQLKIIKVK